MQISKVTNHAEFAELLQDTLTELMRLTVGPDEEQAAGTTADRIPRPKPYRLKYFCVRAIEKDHSKQ